MVTANRGKLARRAIECLARQTWPNLELVIVDDGEEDYRPMLEEFEGRVSIQHHRIKKKDDVFLGGLRNISLDKADGEFCMQWDDDEYYHPDRVEKQMRYLLENKLDAVVLRFALMHLDVPEFVNNPYRIDGIDGIPGTILHRKSSVRYPNQRRSEDTRYMEGIAGQGKLGAMESGSHLFIRCFHGNNTWDRKHFFGKLKRTWGGMFHFWKAKLLQGDILSHPSFQLNQEERDTVEDFLTMSRECGLLEAKAAL
jgi:glycosyltransferase involved in cell wall biosynthesis